MQAEYILFHRSYLSIDCQIPIKPFKFVFIVWMRVSPTIAIHHPWNYTQKTPHLDLSISALIGETLFQGYSPTTKGGWSKRKWQRELMPGGVPIIESEFRWCLFKKPLSKSHDLISITIRGSYSGHSANWKWKWGHRKWDQKKKTKS